MYILLMTYDLVQNGDSQLNAEIKATLKDKGWRDEACYWTKPQECGVNSTTPDTTLWKLGDCQEEGCEDFEDACLEYNAHHLHVRKQAKGKVFCVRYEHQDVATLKLE